MKVIIQNHGKSKSIAITVNDLKNKNENDLFQEMKQPYWSAMGKNCYATITYEAESTKEVYPFKQSEFPNKPEFTIELKPAVLKEKDCNSIQSYISNATYDLIVETIYKDFNVKR
jgi:hypothetical protein